MIALKKLLMIFRRTIQEIHMKWNGGSRLRRKCQKNIILYLQNGKAQNIGAMQKRSNEVLVTVEYPDGTRITEATYTIDGKWKMIAKVLGGIVIAWKPFPEPYKEN